MATCKSIIDGALRKIGVLASGRSATAQEYQDCMEVLQGTYQTWISQGTFGKLNEVTVTNNVYVAMPGDHIFHVTGQVVTLPDLIRYDHAPTGDDYGRGQLPGQMTEYDGTVSPPDASLVKITDNDTGKTLTWMFDGQNKTWQSIEELVLDDEAPLSKRDPNGFRSYMAMILSEEFGMEVGPITVRQAQHFTFNLANRPASYKIQARKDYV